MKKIFRGLVIVMMLALSLTLSGCTVKEKEDDGVLDILCFNFPCYDFARAIAGNEENVEVSMLLKPGVEVHNYEMTPNDLMKIQNSEVIVYVGGESDEWIEGVLENVEDEKLIIKLSDFVTLVPEEFKEGMTKGHEEEHEEEIEYDEHVWTSPKSAARIVNMMKDVLGEKFADHKKAFLANGNEYANKLLALDDEFKEVVSNSNINEIIVGDRFPLIYFTLEYGLEYFAAFPGCAAESEASGKTISFLIDKIKEDNIKYVFKIEMSNEKVANTLCEETGATSLLFHTCHNVTSSEFENGETYESLMRGNIERLKLALNNEEK